MLKSAEELELSRHKTYQKFAKLVMNPQGKAMLEFLAKAEKRHYELLKKHETASMKKGEFTLLEFPPALKAILKAKTVSSNTGDVNIIIKAIANERLDPPFYEGLIQKCNDRKMKKLFAMLKKEELQHLAMLAKELKDMKKLEVSISGRFHPAVLFRNIFKPQKSARP